MLCVGSGFWALDRQFMMHGAFLHGTSICYIHGKGFYVHDQNVARLTPVTWL